MNLKEDSTEVFVSPRRYGKTSYLIHRCMSQMIKGNDCLWVSASVSMAKYAMSEFINFISSEYKVDEMYRIIYFSGQKITFTTPDYFKKRGRKLNDIFKVRDDMGFGEPIYDVVTINGKISLSDDKE